MNGTNFSTVKKHNSLLISQEKQSASALDHQDSNTHQSLCKQQDQSYLAIKNKVNDNNSSRDQIVTSLHVEDS